MSSCCVNSYNLCSIPMCEKAFIELPINAQLSGEYSFLFNYLGSVIEHSKIFPIGEKLSIELVALNEDYAYNLYVFDPNNTLITFVIDGVEYNSFSFCTTQKIKVC